MVLFLLNSNQRKAKTRANKFSASLFDLPPKSRDETISSSDFVYPYKYSHKTTAECLEFSGVHLLTGRRTTYSADSHRYTGCWCSAVLLMCGLLSSSLSPLYGRLIAASHRFVSQNPITPAVYSLYLIGWPGWLVD